MGRLLGTLMFSSMKIIEESMNKLLGTLVFPSMRIHREGHEQVVGHAHVLKREDPERRA